MFDKAYPSLTIELRDRMIAKVAETVRTCYVFEADGRRMADVLLAQHSKGVFDSIKELPDLTTAVSQALQDTKEDLHLSVGSWLPTDGEDATESDDIYKEWLSRMPQRNFEFRKLEVLLGNVGYIDLRAFCPASMAGETATAAMQFLAHTDALIFDLRDNGGGDDLVRYLESYLFSEPTHTMSSRYRPGDRVEQSWTYSYVPGPRFADVPAYILISSSSFSAAEGFAYALQRKGRVTVIGERTRGGAHPVEFYRFPELYLEIMIPNACSEDPITGGNWEDTGVIPDVETSADEALSVAHELALKTLLDKAAENEIQAQRQWALDSVQNARNPISLTASELAIYVGNYGQSIAVTLDESVLRISWGGRRNHAMTPMCAHRFEFDHGTQRAHFNMQDGVIYELVYTTDEGREWKLPKRE